MSVVRAVRVQNRDSLLAVRGIPAMPLLLDAWRNATATVGCRGASPS